MRDLDALIEALWEQTAAIKALTESIRDSLVSEEDDEDTGEQYLGEVRKRDA